MFISGSAPTLGSESCAVKDYQKTMAESIKPSNVRTEFQAVTINVGYGPQYGAFFINSTGLFFNTQGTLANPTANASISEADGWIACGESVAHGRA